MKGENLCILKEKGINVPNFICLGKTDKINMDFSNAGFFAVRSSFDGEDDAAYSFAGQFETILNVPAQQVPEAVHRVFASADNERVAAYEAAHGIKKGEGLKVIVQEMVTPRYSGVIFTANPQGIMNEMVIVIGKGLGSLVVENRINTTAYYYNTSDRIYYYETQEDSPVLKDDIVQKLIQNGEMIETIFHEKMDIEFAIEDDCIFILQARPITTLDKGKPDIILDNSNIAESYPGITLPATQSFVKEVYYKVFRSCLLRLTHEAKTVKRVDGILQNMVGVANGRVYYQISSWYDILLFLPFHKKIIPIWQEMLGVQNKQVTASMTDGISFFTHLKVAASFFYLLISTPKKMKQLNIYFEKAISTYRKTLEDTSGCMELILLYEEMEADLSEKWDITLVNDMYSFLFTALARKKDEQDIKNIKDLESLKPVIHFEKLRELANSEGIESNAYILLRSEYIRLYGDRCPEELKLETHTYRTHPELLDEHILRNTGRAEQKEVSCPALENPHETFLTRRAKTGIRNREISRLNRGRIFGIMREILLKIAVTFVHKGVLEEKEDIFYLYINEIKQAIVDGRPLGVLVEERRRKYSMYEKLPPFSRLVFNGNIVEKAPLNINNQTFGETDGIIRGVPCSSGIIKGYVLIVDKPDAGLDTKDKILVTRMTDPGWVFLIARAKGIIAEKGSLLSHTAIVSRELHKPSIVAAAHASDYLHNGDYIQMDGAAGEILILNKAEGGAV